MVWNQRPLQTAETWSQCSGIRSVFSHIFDVTSIFFISVSFGRHNQWMFLFASQLHFIDFFFLYFFLFYFVCCVSCAFLLTGPLCCMLVMSQFDRSHTVSRTMGIRVNKGKVNPLTCYHFFHHHQFINLHSMSVSMHVLFVCLLFLFIRVQVMINLSSRKKPQNLYHF